MLVDLTFQKNVCEVLVFFLIVNFLRHIYVHSEMSNQKKELIKSSILIPLRTKLKSFIH